ncbi:unnamed protein product [Clonostachys chloroleuca]|uniref:Uncharacterized protein n=1 Tax=Clonostachys chloroleuca TaxID=1926264 RepID=A0AA35Q9Z4_9HYPO|nr:unnamed protein product [Clonostachys chloroleuca]
MHAVSDDRSGVGHTLGNVLLGLIVSRSELGEQLEDLLHPIPGDDNDAVNGITHSQVPWRHSSALGEVANPPGDNYALGPEDLDPEGHDTTADGIGLGWRLLEDDQGVRLGEICPVNVLGDVMIREVGGAGSGSGALWSEQDCRHGGDSDYGR